MWFKRKQKSEVETIKVTVLKGADAAPWPNLTKKILKQHNVDGEQ